MHSENQQSAEHVIRPNIGCGIKCGNFCEFGQLDWIWGGTVCRQGFGPPVIEPGSVIQQDAAIESSDFYANVDADSRAPAK